MNNRLSPEEQSRLNEAVERVKAEENWLAGKVIDLVMLFVVVAIGLLAANAGMKLSLIALGAVFSLALYFGWKQIFGSSNRRD